MNIISKIEENIKQVVKQSVNQCIKAAIFPAMEIGDINVEQPREKEHGEFSSNVAMIIVKQARMAPVKIAAYIIENMDFTHSYILKAECAGPGFINFYLNNDWLYENTAAILKAGDQYGMIEYGQHKKVMVEYVSANPTGPLHMGNARGGALGDLIANVLSKAGYDVTKEFYVNDAGNQIEKFGNSLAARYMQQCLGEDAVSFPEDGYQGIDITNHAKVYIEEGHDSLLEKDSEYRKKALVDYALPKNIAAIKKGLSRYGIKFDNWFRESSLYEDDMVNTMIDTLIEKNLTLEKEGALWLKGEAINSEKDEVIRRSNGFPTYYAADIAYHYNKFKIRNYDWCIDLLGADHHGHVNRMKGAMNAIDINGATLDVVLFQLVRLYRDGEVAKMSKRTGKAISLDDLLDEVGVDAARFFFNMKASGSHLDFDIDLAKKQSNDNPVFYVQYAHARICSMLRILQTEGVTISSETDVDYTLLKENEEIKLMKKLAEYPNEILIVAKTLEPSRITRYVMEVASEFHSFYNACRVKGVEKNLQKSRVSLVLASKIVIKNVLDILSISAPEKM